tara:strand:- start:69 stop:248 length:180 start_codon:yes stop_codon:yes gene_type:complete
MSKVNDWSIELKQMVTTAPCHVCDGDGKVEFQIAVDEFIDEDCDMCDGSGELELDDEDE